jgi:Leucine-rich repeat (LRR) protein
VEMRNLKSLNASYNAISDVSPGAFNGLDALQELNMQQNMIAEVGLFIVYLFILFLQFPTIALHTPKKLTMLDMSYNRIVCLPNDSFEYLSQLDSLNIAHNRIDTIDINAFTALQGLKKLFLNDNVLTRVPTMAVRGLNELRGLDLRYIYYLLIITYLFITFSGNNFQTLPTSCLEGLGRLTELKITRCAQLKRVELNAFSGLFSLNSLELNNNPMLEDIRKWTNISFISTQWDVFGCLYKTVDIVKTLLNRPFSFLKT